MKTVTISAAVITSIALLAGFAASGNQAPAPVKAKTADRAFSSPGKTTAGVTMTHRLSATPVVGQPLALELVFVATASETMQLQINADDALAAGPRVNRSVSNGESVFVELIPQSEGRFYVNVLARSGTGSNAGARSFSIPVQVGKGGAKSSAAKATISPDGERLIRMQAREKPAT